MYSCFSLVVKVRQSDTAAIFFEHRSASRSKMFLISQLFARPERLAASHPAREDNHVLKQQIIESQTAVQLDMCDGFLHGSLSCVIRSPRSKPAASPCGYAAGFAVVSCEHRAPLAQLDRASRFEREGWGFKSLGVRQFLPPHFPSLKTQAICVEFPRIFPCFCKLDSPATSPRTPGNSLRSPMFRVKQ